MMSPSKNQNLITKILKKKLKIFSLELLPRITQELSQWTFCPHNQI